MEVRMRSNRWTRLLAAIVLGAAAAASATALAVDVGDKAPNFALPASTGKDIKSDDFAGKQPTVLFFYVGAFTNT